jgi:hypothetical protein
MNKIKIKKISNMSYDPGLTHLTSANSFGYLQERDVDPTEEHGRVAPTISVVSQIIETLFRERKEGRS